MTELLITSPKAITRLSIDMAVTHIPYNQITEDISTFHKDQIFQASLIKDFGITVRIFNLETVKMFYSPDRNPQNYTYVNLFPDKVYQLSHKEVGLIEREFLDILA